MRVSLVQVGRVRQLARARGLWAKTDRIDARLLCWYGEAIGPRSVVSSVPKRSDCAPWKGNVGTIPCRPLHSRPA